jgi:hypothetical protein
MGDYKKAHRMNELLVKLSQLKGYSYQIWQYNLSHSILTLRGTTKQKVHNNVHISFADVKYFQFPFGWTGDLDLAPDNELIGILVQAGIGRLDQVTSMEYVKEQFSLYKADSPYSTIYILGKLFEIEYDVEPIYS